MAKQPKTTAKGSGSGHSGTISPTLQRSWRELALRRPEAGPWDAADAPISRANPPPVDNRGENSSDDPSHDPGHNPGHEPDEGESLLSFQRLLDTAGSIAALVTPGFLREIDDEIRARIAEAPMELNSYGFDPWGFHTDTARRALVLCTLIYRYYFRAITTGLENLPSGRVLLIANHAGQVAIDAAMIMTACVLEAKPPRIIRGMGEYWLPTLPIINVLMARTGSVVGTPKNCVDLLAHGEAVIAFPEGVRGMNKSWSQRYRLQEFGYGFLRLALQTKTPIVPIAVVGSEEQAPSLGDFKPLARLLGMPAFPLVLTPVPLPVRYHIHFGEPMEFTGSYNDEDDVIGRKVEQVKSRIREMLERGLRQRRSVFR